MQSNQRIGIRETQHTNTTTDCLPITYRTEFAYFYLLFFLCLTRFYHSRIGVVMFFGGNLCVYNSVCLSVMR